MDDDEALSFFLGESFCMYFFLNISGAHIFCYLHGWRNGDMGFLLEGVWVSRRRVLCFFLGWDQNLYQAYFFYKYSLFLI